ncbi:pentatricopeptide repeat-containing protein At4g14820-like [Typha latifolia]|uniref:pentatricopeptide repeat-containing protein At4g14820-like n=1 Tax=Typha latifolia TaxID=4733 RepID=UPI003C2F6A58
MYMIDFPFRPTARSLVRLIKSISPTSPSSLLEAQTLHSFLTKTGLLSSNEFISSALTSLYSYLGRIFCARKLFDEMPQPGMVFHTAMARAYVAVNRPMEALVLFRAMRSGGLSLDPVALATAITACRQLGGDPKPAKVIHGFIVTSGAEIDPFVSTELIRIYGGSYELALSHKIFDAMPVKTVVAWNAIIHQFVKHGEIQTGYRLFIEMPNRDAISWNTLISGYCQVGQYREALSAFRKMLSSQVKPNILTMCTVLSACASIGMLETGIWVHSYIERNCTSFDGSLDHCLIDMYAKCGSIEKAVQVFEKVPMRRDLYSWTSVICALAMHGIAIDAVQMFARMQQVGVPPDEVTFVGVLNACAHGGLIEKGFQYFYSMEEMYGLAPKIEHYGCMIDLLGRVGRLKEAYDLIMGMPMKPNAVMWGTLLSACKVHNNVELGEVAAAKVIELDPHDPWSRVMLSNMHAEAQDWSEVMKLRKELKGIGMRKTPGCSLIEISGEVNEFVAGGSLHPQHAEIFALLANIEAQMHIN